MDGPDPSEDENAGTVDDPAVQKALFEDAYTQTCRVLEDGAAVTDIEALSRANASRSAAIDEIAADFAADGGAECATGCSYCCHQMVVCTPLEIFIIARHILDAKTGSEIATLREKLAQRAPLPLDVQSRYAPDKPCALLDEHRCTVYAHRPSVCRTMLSRSRMACETSLNTGDQKVPFIAEPVVIAFLMQLGIDFALMRLGHLATEKVELSRALSLALDHFDATFQNWINGQEAFPDCHISTSNRPSNQDLAERAAAQCGLL